MTDLHLLGKRLEQYCWHPKNVALILRCHYPKSIVIACSLLRPKRQVDNLVVNLADNPIAPLSSSLEGVEMAISLFCYSSRAAEDVEGILDLLSVRHQEFFAGKSCFLVLMIWIVLLLTLTLFRWKLHLNTVCVRAVYS